MGNIPTIASIASGATSLSNLLMVTPQSTVGYQPQNTPTQNELGASSTAAAYTQPALIFHYEGENKSNFGSDITDHWTEDNTAIQDQIALKPISITVQGFIGELNDIPPNKIFAAAFKAANKLTAISAYTPALSTTALLAYNEAVFAYTTATNLAESAVSAYTSITGSGSSGTSVISANGISTQPNQTKQQIYYQQLYYYWGNRTLFTIQTPWAIFTDMAIENCQAIQNAETNVITDFQITFKQMRFATLLTETQLYSNNANFSGRLQQQGAPVTQLGTNSLTASTNSFADSLATTVGL